MDRHDSLTGKLNVLLGISKSQVLYFLELLNLYSLTIHVPTLILDSISFTLLSVEKLGARIFISLKTGHNFK